MTTTKRRIAVVGGTGFIGRSVVRALEQQGHSVLTITAPRILATPTNPVEVKSLARDWETRHPLSQQLEGCEVVINAAGVSQATGADEARMYGANSVLPRTIREAAVHAGCQRVIQISSAGVQGRRTPLDESAEVEPFSPYTRSKALGEAALRQCPETTIFRPTSVHGPDRDVTRSLIKFARSPLASVAGAGDQPTPQVLVENVASAIAFVASRSGEIPQILLQPSEGLTTRSLLVSLGAQDPRHVPLALAKAAIRSSSALGPIHPTIGANGRRLEMLWFGQTQESGWLTTQGWTPPSQRSAWSNLPRGMAK